MTQNITRRLKMIVLAASVLVAGPVLAALKPGAAVSDFSTQGALAGETFEFSLDDALQRGPVVLYFFPKAFTPGCTVEAHLFAEATAQYAALGATVVGVSADDIDTLKQFSLSECRGKFAVLSDPKLKVAKAFDATLMLWPGRADRTSYVISPDGKIVYSYSALAPEQHISNTLEALRTWRTQHPLLAKD